MFSLVWQTEGVSAKVEAGGIRFWTSQNDEDRIKVT